MVCDRVIIIGRGKVLAQGTPEELKNRAGAGIRVEVKGPTDQVRSALLAISGVDRVEVLQSGNISRLSVLGRATPEIREQIAAALSQRGWPLRELRLEGTSLEEFFVQITDPGAVPEAAAA